MSEDGKISKQNFVLFRTAYYRVNFRFAPVKFVLNIPSD